MPPGCRQVVSVPVTVVFPRESANVPNLFTHNIHIQKDQRKQKPTHCYPAKVEHQTLSPQI